MARLAALIPRPRMNLARFCGVFAPNHSLRRQITQTKPRKALSQGQHQHKNANYRLTWAERLKRVFHINIEHCEHCGGKVKIIATIKDPIVIKKILDHVEGTKWWSSFFAHIYVTNNICVHFSTSYYVTKFTVPLHFH